MELDQVLGNIYQLPPESLTKLKAIIGDLVLPKGKVIIRDNRVEEYIYFIKTGIARAFAKKGHRDITFCFSKEGDALLSMRSYVEELPGYESIELLEECELYQLKAGDLIKLYDQDIHIANWGRKFAEHEIMRAEKRLINLQFGTATARYKELLVENPSLIQRVSLGHIASYLGISQVSLSRIRAEIK